MTALNAHRVRPVRVLSAILLGLILAAPAQAFQWPNQALKTSEAPHWGYSGEHGPSHWGDLTSEYATCKDGKSQSPLDLNYARRVDYEPLSFRYRSDTLTVTNNGHTMQVASGPGSYLVIKGHEYALQQFHFHTPSEHRIQGVPAAMELHLVHRDTQGKIAVVGVLINPGLRNNSTLKRIADALPSTAGESFYGRQIAINPLFLLPPQRSYFSYLGSLTTPPCTEGVDWFVMTEPVEVEASLIARFQQAMGANARPPQPDHGRSVLGMFRR